MRFVYQFEDVEMELPLSTEQKKINENLDDLRDCFHDLIKQSKLFSVFKLLERHGE
jgi:hypothetical protein